MRQWIFLDFLEANGKNAIMEWLVSLPAGARAKIDARILQMMAMVRWPEKWISAYKGYDDIYELRIPWNKVQYRPLGRFGPESRQFTLLIGAVEKGGKIPKGRLETAVQRRLIILADRSRTCEHQFG